MAMSVHYGVCGCCHRALIAPPWQVLARETAQRVDLCRDCREHIVFELDGSLGVSETCSHRQHGTWTASPAGVHS